MIQVSQQSRSIGDDVYLTKMWSGSSHELARRYVETLGEGSWILDVGAATGMLGRSLPPSRYRLVGIEPDPTRARAASPFYDEMMISSLEDVQYEDLRDFDLIVCCDVLEHLPHPAIELRRMVRTLGHTAKFVISVPNVAHLWIRMNLLFGRFAYRDRGILDRTHLRFFTRTTFSDMLDEGGLEPLWIRPTPVPLELIHRAFLDSGFGRMAYGLQQLAVNLFPRLLGYQFVCLATKRKDENG